MSEQLQNHNRSKEYFKLNNKENARFLNLWDVIKAVLSGGCVELNANVKNMNYDFNLQIEKKKKLNSK